MRSQSKWWWVLLPLTASLPLFPADPAPEARGTVRARVRDLHGEPIPSARVTLEPGGPGSAGPLALRFDPESNEYRAEAVPAGPYRLHAEAPGFLSNEASVEVAPARMRFSISLAPPKTRYYYRGRQKVFVHPPEDVIAVAVRPGIPLDFAPARPPAWILPELEIMETPEPLQDQGILLVRFRRGLDRPDKRSVLRSLLGLPEVLRAGPVLKLCDSCCVFLTDQLAVRFPPSLHPGDLPALIESQGLEIVQEVPYSSRTYLLRSQAPPDLELLSIANAWVESGVAEWAEPDLATPSLNLSIFPGDYLYLKGQLREKGALACDPEWNCVSDCNPGALGFGAHQWHIDWVRLPEAWQFLRNLSCERSAGSEGDLRFGDPGLLLAIMDRGVRSINQANKTVAEHPDFNGDVAAGVRKVFEFFDFNTMEFNNDDVSGDQANHGTCVAGIASALADNPSPGRRGPPPDFPSDCCQATPESPWETIFREGIVGAAPNVPIMALKRPLWNFDTDSHFANAFAWTGGLIPGPGWPEPGRGADIINGSFYRWCECSDDSEAPIPTLIREAFLWLTTAGRDGKGVLLFFGAGRPPASAPGDYYENRHVLAREPTTIAVGATRVDPGSTVEGWDPSSNCGTYLDVSAPTNLVTTDLTTGSDLRGHPGSDCQKEWYMASFGGTSAATPLVAGVAALVLSVNPELEWWQVRDILRDSAVPIHRTEECPAENWGTPLCPCAEPECAPLDPTGKYSCYFGYGRVDAFAAVLEADRLAHPESHCQPFGGPATFSLVHIPVWTLPPPVLPPGIPPLPLPRPGRLESVLPADLDRDGDWDILAAISNPGVLAWLENPGRSLPPHPPGSEPSTPWASHVLTRPPRAALALASGDLDGDGDLDVLTTSRSGNHVSWLENPGRHPERPWASHSILPGIPDARTLEAADVDGDGDVDVLAGSFRSGNVFWFENADGRGTLWSRIPVPGRVRGVSDLAPADLDGDGDTDVLSASLQGDRISWHENLSGAGTGWTLHVISQESVRPRSIVAADLDKDGDMDILSAAEGTAAAAGRITWHENRFGDASEWAAAVIRSSLLDHPGWVALADLDCDGDPDIVATSSRDGRAAWFKNPLCGGGDWVETLLTGAVARPAQIHPRDLDGDGDLDLLFRSERAPRIPWLVHNGI